jgi:hypothetical protein
MGMTVVALALALAFAGCSTEPDGSCSSDPLTSLAGSPQLALGGASHLDIMVSSDKELYEVGETAHFMVAVYKNGELWAGDNTLIDATFPDESAPVSLTPVSDGIYSYDVALPSDGQKTLTASATHDYISAIIAMDAHIQWLQAEIAQLETQLADETDPNKQRILEAKIDNRLSMIDKFEEKIANMDEPMAVGMATITVETPAPPVLLVWMNCMNGAQTQHTHLVSDTLGEAIQAVSAELGIPPDQVDSYVANTRPGDPPFDETKTLEELGITADHTRLYVWIM